MECVSIYRICSDWWNMYIWYRFHKSPPLCTGEIVYTWMLHSNLSYICTFIVLSYVFNCKPISPLVRTQDSSLTYKYYLNSHLFTLSHWILSHWIYSTTIASITSLPINNRHYGVSFDLFTNRANRTNRVNRANRADRIWYPSCPRVFSTGSCGAFV